MRCKRCASAGALPPEQVHRRSGCVKCTVRCTGGGEGPKKAFLVVQLDAGLDARLDARLDIRLDAKQDEELAALFYLLNMPCALKFSKCSCNALLSLRLCTRNRMIVAGNTRWISCAAPPASAVRAAVLASLRRRRGEIYDVSIVIRTSDLGLRTK